jgi:hypothetical protein
MCNLYDGVRHTHKIMSSYAYSRFMFHEFVEKL